MSKCLLGNLPQLNTRVCVCWGVGRGEVVGCGWGVRGGGGYKKEVSVDSRDDCVLLKKHFNSVYVALLGDWCDREL